MISCGKIVRVDVVVTKGYLELWTGIPGCWLTDGVSKLSEAAKLRVLPLEDTVMPRQKQSKPKALKREYFHFKPSYMLMLCVSV